MHHCLNHRRTRNWSWVGGLNWSPKSRNRCQRPRADKKNNDTDVFFSYTSGKADDQAWFSLVRSFRHWLCQPCYMDASAGYLPVPCVISKTYFSSLDAFGQYWELDGMTMFQMIQSAHDVKSPLAQLVRLRRLGCTGHVLRHSHLIVHDLLFSRADYRGRGRIWTLYVADLASDVSLIWNLASEDSSLPLNRDEFNSSSSSFIRQAGNLDCFKCPSAGTMQKHRLQLTHNKGDQGWVEVAGSSLAKTSHCGYKMTIHIVMNYKKSR